ncbi:MAG TPA: LysR family transcriptional regulator, partial [Burkholderiaceae bacterium]|nr:LysR family transcriptional regulator [Burkholderiaceae bacterium]
MVDLNDVQFFARVVDKGSFAAAAKALAVPKSRLSRRVAALETRLGVRLLHRTTRKLSLTDVGRDYYAHARAMLSAAEAAERAAADRSGTPRGLLRISCPLGLVQHDLPPVISAFLLRYPEVRIEILATNRRVDLLEEGVDLALRVRVAGQEDPNLATRHLRDSAPIFVAAPSLLKKYGPVREPEDLQRVPTIDFSVGPEPAAWPLVGPNGEARRVEIAPRLRVDDFVALTQAAVDGVGVALLPDYLCSEEVENGTLVRLLPQWQRPAGKI